jgi:hypothetical protein
MEVSIHTLEIRALRDLIAGVCGAILADISVV